MRILFAVFLLSGCAALQPAADTIAKGVTKYCEQPYEARAMIRQQINTATAPNTIKVTCEGDPA